MEPRFVYDWKFVAAECAARVIALPAVILGFHYGLHVFVRRVASTEWESYSFPYTENQAFPESLAMLVLALMAIVALGGGTVFLKYGARWKWRQVGEEAFIFVLGLSLAAELCYLVCDMTKKMVGRPRPDFLARCFHGRTTEQWMSDNHWSSFTDIPAVPDCQPDWRGITKKQFEDGRMSFPSAHTAMSFCFISFCALWIYAKMCMIRNTGAWRLLLPIGYLLVALVIAISRTSDYRHHPSDVWAGGALGILTAYLCYVFYFPLQMRPLAETVYKFRRQNNQCKIKYRDPAKVYKNYINSIDDSEEDFHKVVPIEGRPRTTDTDD